MRLVALLLDFLFPMRASEAIVAHTSLEEMGALLDPGMIDADTVSLLPYHRPLVQAFITEAKFKDNHTAQKILATMLRNYLEEWLQDQTELNSSKVVLIPVPLSHKRSKERGYNQCERIARLALEELPGIELQTDPLTRVRDTLPQTGLDALARRTNLEEAFMAPHALNSTYTYIVFDDVTTTGSTLLAARTALLKNGATRVYGLSLAH